MYKKTLMQTARRLFLLAAATGTLLVSGASQVMAAPGGGAVAVAGRHAADLQYHSAKRHR